MLLKYCKHNVNPQILTLLSLNSQEQESAQASEQRCVQLEKAQFELELQLSGLSERLEEEEVCSTQLAFHRDRLEDECSNLRRDLDELESALFSSEQDKQVKHDGMEGADGVAHFRIYQGRKVDTQVTEQGR